MQHHLLYEFHLLVHGQLHAAEDLLYHGHPPLHVRERSTRDPAGKRLGGLADVVQHGPPAQPEIIAYPAQVVQHFEGVVEVVLVRLPSMFSTPCSSWNSGR